MANPATKKEVGIVDKTFQMVDNIATGFLRKMEAAISKLSLLLGRFIGNVEADPNIDVSLSQNTIDSIITESGFFVVVNELLNSGYQGVLTESLVRHEKLFKNIIQLSPKSLNRLNKLKATDLSQYVRLERNFAIDLNNQIIGLNLETVDATNILKTLNDKLIPKIKNDVSVVIDTGLKGAYRTGNNAIATDAGLTMFQYVGGLIQTSRKFCIKHLNEIKTLEQWDELSAEQGQIAPVSTFLGGFRCQHDFIAVG